MANFYLPLFLRRSLTSEVGEVRDYYRLLVFPQSFIFILIIVLASFLRVDNILELTVIHLSAIVVVWLWMLLYRSWRFSKGLHFAEWMLLSEVATLLLLLVGFSCFFAANQVLSFFLPTALLLVACVAFHLNMRRKLVLSALVLVSVGLHRVLFLNLSIASVSYRSQGVWIVLFSMLLLLLKPTTSSESQRDQLFELESGEDEEGFDDELTSQENVIDDREWGQLVAYSNKEVRKEFISEFSWRLGGVSLFFAATTIMMLYLEGVKNREAGLLLLLFLFLYSLAHHSLLRQKSVRGISLCAFLGITCVFFNVILLAFYDVGGDLVIFFMALLFQLSLGIIPWNLFYACCAYGSVLAVTVALVVLGQFPAPVLLFSPLVLAFSVRTAFLLRLGVLSQVVPLIVSQRMGVVSTRSLLYLLASHMGGFVGSKQGIVIAPDRRAEIIRAGAHWESSMEELYCRGVIQRVKDFGKDGGILAGFEKQFSVAFKEWFGLVPRRVLFVRLTPVLDQKAEEILILVPYTWSAQLAGQRRLIRAVSTASSLVRVWTVAARSRYISSDVILTSQRLQKESEHELNQVVHRVNNVAQDVSIQCEEIRDTLSAGSRSESESSLIQDRVEHIATSIRFLSIEASDIKLIKELLRVKNYRHSENVRVGVLVEELRSFGKYLSFEYGSTLSLNVNIDEDGFVKVASREFLETSLRAGIRLALRSRRPDLQVELTISSDGELIDFMLDDNGDVIHAEQKDKILEARFAGVIEEVDYLRALVNLARLSGGEFRFEDPGEDFSNRIVLSVPVGSAAVDRTKGDRRGWVLLVDDNSSVTTFYARIVDAMDLSYETAESIETAFAHLERKGEPLLVITDLQLEGGNGLQIVKKVRSEFGGDVPVFVVSGETEADLVARVKQAGADLYLTKPVGRRKLYSEIQNILL